MRRRVSGAQPTVKDHFEESGSVLEKEVMVRQVPFMEIEAPSSASGRMVGQEVIVRVVPEVAPAEGSDGVRFDIVPISSTRPVNILTSVQWCLGQLRF